MCREDRRDPAHPPPQRQRWKERLEQDPWVLDLLDRGPGDPEWRRRVIDARTITVPMLCVAGWRDLFCDPTIRAFEQARGPKKLLVGPWMHTMPHVAPAAAVDFPELALRWWRQPGPAGGTAATCTTWR
jgi:predicted acyl esterase